MNETPTAAGHGLKKTAVRLCISLLAAGWSAAAQAQDSVKDPASAPAPAEGGADGSAMPASDPPANDAAEDAVFDVDMKTASLTYSGSLALALPMGGWGGVGAGAFFHGDYSFKKLKGLHFVGRLGVITHLPKDYQAVTEVPVLVGAKWFIIPRFYVGLELGLAVYYDAKAGNRHYLLDDKFGAWFADILRVGYDMKGPWSFGVDFFYARTWDALLAAEYRF